MIPSGHETDIAFDDPIHYQTINLVNLIVHASWLCTKRCEYFKFNSLNLIDECK